MALNEIAAWPGKSDRRTPPKLLPAAWHMLDVAACAEKLMIRHKGFNTLSEPMRQGLLFLILLHDLGKFSRSFRDMLLEGHYQPKKHWELSHWYFLTKEDLFLQHLKCCASILHHLSPAVSGHHGIPPNNEGLAACCRSVGDDALKAASAFITMAMELFPEASLADISTEAEAKRLSWLLSGLTIQADWLGSNTCWFPLERKYNSFSEAWQDARLRAGQAVCGENLAPAEPAPFISGTDLCGFSPLRPMQEEAGNIDLPRGPVMALIEDATGAGKTEAAMILAHRLIAEGKANGIFFALPTMATANAMYERLPPIVDRMYQKKGENPPSFILAHSRRNLHPTFHRTVVHTPSHSDTPTCSAWLADDRRLALLAEIGVGTIDQALTAVLPVRFNTLRLWGLAGKVLIVDEAHSYDPYMEAELEALLKFHAMLGNSAIVMTATLPRPMRERYAQAYLAGLGIIERRQKPLPETAYPALTVLSARNGEQEIKTTSVPPVPATCRTLHVRRLENNDQAVALLREATNAGAACVWIRNAVDDAISAVKQLRDEGIEADLLHARFTMWDRLRIEQTVQRRFGKQGLGRAGRVLIGTQVIEASLDLDFDVMISDLAPIGALLQRAGRLWRHMEKRPRNARPKIAATPEGDPILHVLSPDPEQVKDENWLNETLGRGAWVYDVAEQWRTAKIIFDNQKINTPGDLRRFIGAVHGNESEKADIPAPLKRQARQEEGEQHAQRGLGRMNTLIPAEGYDQGANMPCFRDSVFPTRLGESQVTLLLLRRDGDELIPWAQAADRKLRDDPLRAEALSEVRLSSKRFDKLAEKPDQNLPEIRTFTGKWPEWKRRQIHVAIVSDNGDICQGLQYSACSGLLITSPHTRG